jgi:hypothetical protein
LVFGTPALAIVGGIVAGILKTRGQQRLIELAQRERIAAIEKGLAVSLLPALPGSYDPSSSARQITLRRAQGLMIGGILTFALGVGLSLTLWLMPASDGQEAWPIGFVPAFMGMALLLASRLLRRDLE